jgi:biopolymer transport protein ExbB
MEEMFHKGGPVMWWLLGLSMISATFIIERFVFFWVESLRHKPKTVQKILSYVEKGRVDDAVAACAKAPGDFVVRTIRQGLLHRDHALTRALETQAFEEVRRMKKYLGVLDTVITAAPLLGILGTVIGIIGSFDALGVGGQQNIGDPLAVTRGISEALITTAFGLIITLGTLIPYNYFQSTFQRFVEELEGACSVLEVDLRKCAVPCCPKNIEEREYEAQRASS